MLLGRTTTGIWVLAEARFLTTNPVLFLQLKFWLPTYLFCLMEQIKVSERRVIKSGLVFTCRDEPCQHFMFPKNTDNLTHLTPVVFLVKKNNQMERYQDKDNYASLWVHWYCECHVKRIFSRNDFRSAEEMWSIYILWMAMTYLTDFCSTNSDL